MSAPDPPVEPSVDPPVEPAAEAPVEPSLGELLAEFAAPDPEPPVADVPAEDDADGDADAVLARYPPVVAVVVTRNPGPWLEATIGSLAEQDYTDLTVLVVDCGSDDDPTPRVAAVLPRAFVRRLEADAGFANAANEALRTVEGATFLLLCHDDVVLDPSAVRVLVEEAYRSNAGILGPKIVSAEHPDVLLEVGRAIDRFGAPHTGIEPGEVDQEQHDGVRDVFYVTTATMLVRTDLFRELDGFDPATFPGAEDLDLCWRARLAGARVLVAPDARITHREAAGDRSHSDRPDEFALARSRVRVLFTSYSLPHLLWLVPFGFVVGFIEAIGDLFIGRPRRARAAVGSWFSNVLHFRSLRASRKRAQRLRTVHDSDLRELQVSSTARLGAFLAHHLHTDTRLRNLGDVSRSAMDSASDGVRTPAAVAFLGFLALVAFGSRSFVTQGVPAIGTFAKWPGIGDLFDTFGSAWRFTGLGSASPPPSVLALMGAMGGVLLGAVGLARTLLIVLALPFGAFGAYRLGRRIIDLRGPALAAGLAYGINPVARNALGEGRLGPLVLYALLPFLLLRVIRLGERSDRRKGRILRLAVLGALLAAWYPVGLGLFVVAVGALVVTVPIAGGARMALRAFGIAIVAALGALVVLLPWPLAYAHTGVDKAALGFAFRPALDLSQIMRFDTGPSGAGWAMWGLVVAAAVPLFVATGERLAWTARGWVLALVGWAIVWVPARFFPHTSVLAPEAGLTLAALGLALAVGVAVSVFVDGIHSFKFGWRQPAIIIGAVAIILPALSFTADTADGRWHAPDNDWTSTLAFTQAASDRGEFRMLWVGDPTVLPLDPVVLRDGTGYTLTRNGPGDATEQWRAPEHSADQVVDRALALVTAGRTNRLGRMLAPMGVRYVVVPATQGKGGGARGSGPGCGTRRDGRAARPRPPAVERGPGALREPGVRADPGRRAGSRPGRLGPAEPRRPRHRSHRRGRARFGAGEGRHRPLGRGVRLRMGRDERRFVVAPRAGVRLGQRLHAREARRRVDRVRRAVAAVGGPRRFPRDLAVRAVALAEDPGAARSRGARGDRTTPAGAQRALRPAHRGARRGRLLVGARVSDTDPEAVTSEPTSPDRTSPDRTSPDRTKAARRARRVRRGPILLVVLAAVIAAVVVQQGASSTSTPSAATVGEHGVSVAPADAASTAWYCAEGTATTDGRADETVIVASLSPTQVVVTITVMPGGDAAPQSRRLQLAPGEETRVRVSDILETPEPGVVVEVVGGRAVVSHQLDHGDDFAVEPCTRAAASEWYFAAGTTVAGTEHDLALFNPFGDDAIVDVQFVTDTGVQEPDGLQALVIPRRSRVTVPVQDFVPRQERVATRVHARVGRVVVERTQIFDGTVPDSGPTRQGIALSLGATSPARRWRIPAGTTENGGTASLSLANFTSRDASVEVHVVLVGNQTLAPQTIAIPSRGVTAVDVSARVPLGTEYAITATARDVDGHRVPVVAEVLISWAPASSTTGVGSTLGTTATARRWVVPQPDVVADGFVTVYNPGTEPVTATLLPADEIDRRVGPSSEPEVAIAPGKAKIVKLSLLVGSSSAAVVTANHPIVVGLTALGEAGASISSGIPDPAYAG